MEYRRKEVFETDGITLKRVFKKPEGIHAFVRAPACGLRVCHRGNSKAVWKVRKKGFRPKVPPPPPPPSLPYVVAYEMESLWWRRCSGSTSCLNRFQLLKNDLQENKENIMLIVLSVQICSQLMQNRLQISKRWVCSLFVLKLLSNTFKHAKSLLATVPPGLSLAWKWTLQYPLEALTEWLWVIRTLFLLACQVRVTEGDLGLCCYIHVTSFER